MSVTVRSRRSVRRGALVAMMVAILACVTPSVADAQPSSAHTPARSADPAPSADPFYTPPAGFGSTRPGTVLRTRTVTIAFAGVPTPVRATQALYRTTDQHGSPTATVTTILRPSDSAPVRDIVSYQIAYDGLGGVCDPSYTLRGNGVSPLTTAEELSIGSYLAAGHTVVTSDYEGRDLAWTVGRQSGYAALDGIRAAESVLRVSSSTSVGLVGYSGGSVPTQYAAELAPTYAPELHLVGAAAGGLPVELAHNLTYVSGTQDWSSAIPAIVVGYERAYHLPVNDFLSARGMQTTSEIQTRCIADFLGQFPGLTDADMVRAPFQSLKDVPSVAAALNDNIMGAAGTPRVPMLLGIGQSDQTGDGVMITADVRSLAAEYCSRGVRVDYIRYAGLSHGTAYPVFETDASRFLADRFAGRPTRVDCQAAGTTTDLGPIPVPAG